MTANINKQTASATAKNAETVTLTVGGKTIEIPVEGVTSVTTVLLAARKEAYGLKRGAKAKAQQAAKAASAAKKIEKAAAAKAKAEAKLAALKAEIEKMEAAAA